MPGGNVRHSRGLMYVTQKVYMSEKEREKGEVLERGEKKGVVSPESHSILPICL